MRGTISREDMRVKSCSSSSPERGAGAPSGDSFDTNRTRVLLVDDDDGVLGVMTRWVREAGFEAVTCETFDAANACLHGWKPDVLVTDVRLTGDNGLHLV